MPRFEREKCDAAVPAARALEQAHRRLAVALAAARHLGLGQHELATLIEQVLARQGGRHDN